jgi:hypothetical protein
MFAIGLAATSASALPSFKPAEGEFTATGKVTTIKLGPEDTILCSNNVTSGAIAGSMQLSSIVLHLLNCDALTPTESCGPIHSEGAPGEGLIATATLNGILGLILPGTAVGLLLLPASGTIFLKLVGDKCVTGGVMTGALAGLVRPVGVSQATAKVIFTAGGTNQEVKEVDTLSGLVKPRLALGFAVSMEAEESITWSKAIEIT